MEHHTEFSRRDIRRAGQIAAPMLPIANEDMQGAIDAIRGSLHLEPGDLRPGLDIARNQLERGLVADALTTYAVLVCCDPDDAEFQIGLSNCAFHAGKSALSLQAAAAAVALLPDDPRGYLLAGRACFVLGHIDEARNFLTEVTDASMAARHLLVVADCRRLLGIINFLDQPLVAIA
jgi:Flp pilus assembly protein TadD